MIIGIDEVGRGPIAGPVCVAAFFVPQPAYFKKLLKKAIEEHKLPLRDSKKLSALQRASWHKLARTWKKEGHCFFAITSIQAKTIDRIGISLSIQKALNSSLQKVHIQSRHFSSVTLLLDGGLHAPKHYTKQKTIIRGDEKEYAIALASIVAKEHRDRYMRKIAKLYPNYGFESHVGYGTKAHYAAIKKHGRTDIHRTSFLGS